MSLMLGVSLESSANKACVASIATMLSLNSEALVSALITQVPTSVCKSLLLRTRLSLRSTRAWPVGAGGTRSSRLHKESAP